MLGTSNIDDFLARIGVSDMTYSVLSKDSFGDLITVFDPDTDYSVVNRAVQGSRPIRDKIVDSGIDYSEIVDDVYISGNKVTVAILCERGDMGFGTRIKMMVKKIDYPINNELKSFLGFESLKNYLTNVEK